MNHFGAPDMSSIYRSIETIRNQIGLNEQHGVRHLRYNNMIQISTDLDVNGILTTISLHKALKNKWCVCQITHLHQP